MVCKRVLILLQNEPVPSDRHVWNESTALARAGYDVTVICPTGEQRDRSSFERDRRRQDPPLRAAPRGRRRNAAMRSSTSRRSGACATSRAASPASARSTSSTPAARRTSCSRCARAAPSGRAIHLRPPRPHSGALPDPLRRLACVHRVTLAGRADRVPQRGRRALGQRLVSARRDERGRRAPRRRRGRPTGPDLKRFPRASPTRAQARESGSCSATWASWGRRTASISALRALAELRAARDDWHAVFMGDGDVLERDARAGRRARARRLRRVHRLGRARHHPAGAVDLGRLPRPGSEEPAQRRLLDGQDLRVHGDVTADRLLRPRRVAGRRGRGCRLRRRRTTTRASLVWSRICSTILGGAPRWAQPAESAPRACSPGSTRSGRCWPPIPAPSTWGRCTTAAWRRSAGC